MSSQLQHVIKHNDHKPTVLIVDDSKVIRLALSKILKKDFEVIQAVDGEDGWHKLEENEAIIAVFSDVSMPHLDGFGLLDRVRGTPDPHIASMPFIIITANDDVAGFHERVTSSGGTDLITKPFKTKQITECIQQHIKIEEQSDNEDQTETSMSDHDVANILGLDQYEDVTQTETPAVTITANETANEVLDSTTRDELEVSFSIDEAFLNQSEDAGNFQAETVDELDIDLDINFDQPEETPLDIVSNEPSESEFMSPAEEKTLSNLDLPEENTESITTDEQSDFTIKFEDILDDETQPENLQQDDPALSLSENAFTLDHSKDIETDIPGNDEIPAPEFGCKKLELEQARKRAMDIAREQAEHDAQYSEEDIALREKETSEIRKTLDKLREQERFEGDKYVSSGKTTFFFHKIVSIISRIFSFLK